MRDVLFDVCIQGASEPGLVRNTHHNRGFDFCVPFTFTGAPLQSVISGASASLQFWFGKSFISWHHLLVLTHAFTHLLITFTVLMIINDQKLLSKHQY